MQRKTKVNLELPLLPRSSKILDFDVETVAAGFADPNWVPQKITCVAWSWIDSDKVESRVCGPEGLFGKPQNRKKMLTALLTQIRKADMVTGHNLLRFDLPVIMSECLRLGLPILPTLLVQDTMKLHKTKGFKKGQENIAKLLKLPAEKQAMDWQEWQDAYDEKGWALVRSRAETDVIQHKLMRSEMIKNGWLKSPIKWSP